MRSFNNCLKALAGNSPLCVSYGSPVRKPDKMNIFVSLYAFLVIFFLLAIS